MVAAVAAWWIASMPTEQPVLAVVPFHNLGPDSAEDHWGETISRSVYLQLREVGATVVDWDAARSLYEGGDIPRDVARELGADFALYATYEFQENDEFVLSLELIAADTGVAEWIEELPSSYSNLQQMKGDISLLAARNLNIELTGEQQLTLATPETESPDAYELYSMGAFLLRSAVLPEEMEGALRYFEAALEEDSRLVEAHIGIGAARVAQFWGGGGSTEGLREARESYETAARLDETAMRAYRGLMIIHFLLGGDNAEEILRLGQTAARFARDGDVEALLTKTMAGVFGAFDDETADAVVRRALDADPYNEETYFWALINSWTISPIVAQRYADEQFRLSGADPEGLMYLAFSYQLADELGPAIERYREAIALGQGGGMFVAEAAKPEVYIFGGLALERDGREVEATELWEEGLVALRQQITDAPGNLRLRFMAAALYGLLGDEEMMRESELAGREQTGPWSIGVLAAVHGKRGDLDAAAALVERIPTPILFKEFYRMATGRDPRTVPELRELLEAGEARLQRLRNEYPTAYRLDAGR
jgi:TolB-like protein